MSKSLPYEIMMERWPLADGKGIDDVLNAGGKPELLAGKDAMNAIRDAYQRSGAADKANSSGGISAGGGKGESTATVLVKLALDAGVELFHSSGGDPEGYATIPTGGHFENYRLSSRQFREWLRSLYWTTHQSAPNAQAVQDAIGVLTGIALFDGPEHSVSRRVAGNGGEIFIDLCNASWQAVHITASGYSVVSHPPVKFIRSRGMLPLPVPVPGGCLRDLQRHINVPNDSDFSMVLGWLVNSLHPHGPYGILNIHGEQGSAKTTTSRRLRSVTDPNTAPLRAEPREPRDLAIAATNSWLLGFDNFSSIPAWLSDAMCRLATGGGWATRELYSDGEEKLFDSQRSQLVNGIPELATRPDLMDRSITIYTPKIADSKRLTEAELDRRFEVDRPRILGALYDAASTSLRNLPNVTLPKLPRMADFAIRSVAAEPTFGVPAGTFLAAYEDNRRTMNETAIESSVIYKPLVALLGRCSNRWEGPASLLLDQIELDATDKALKAKDWPRKPNVLSGMLRRIAPNLRHVGIDVEFDRDSNAGRGRKIIVALVEDGEGSCGQVGKTSSTSSESSCVAENGHVDRPEDRPGDRPAPASGGNGIVRDRPGSSGADSTKTGVSDDVDGVDDLFRTSTDEGVTVATTTKGRQRWAG